MSHSCDVKLSYSSLQFMTSSLDTFIPTCPLFTRFAFGLSYLAPDSPFEHMRSLIISQIWFLTSRRKACLPLDVSSSRNLTENTFSPKLDPLSKHFSPPLSSPHWIMLPSITCPQGNFDKHSRFFFSFSPEIELPSLADYTSFISTQILVIQSIFKPITLTRVSSLCLDWCNFLLTGLTALSWHDPNLLHTVVNVFFLKYKSDHTSFLLQFF